MGKRIKKYKEKKDKTIEIIALVLAFLCLVIGFLALSGHMKIQSQSTAHPEELNFRVVFSTSHKGEKINPIVPKVEPRDSGATAENATIINRSNPVLTNLKVNFTKSGQRARYTFYVYNAGEYMSYLNNIVYSNVSGFNKQKVCITKDGNTSEVIKNVCDDIEISVKIGDIHTKNSLYGLYNKYLRPRTAQLVEVTIEYLDGGHASDENFEVIFGDIQLQYSMFPGNNNNKPAIS